MEHPKVIGLVLDSLLAGVVGVLHPPPERREGALSLLQLAGLFGVDTYG